MRNEDSVAKEINIKNMGGTKGMETLILIGLVVVAGLQILSLMKKQEVNVETKHNPELENKINTLSTKIETMDNGLDNKIKLIITDQMTNISKSMSNTEKELVRLLGEYNSVLIKTLSNNEKELSEALLKKFASLEKSITVELTNTKTSLTESFGELKTEMTKNSGELKASLGTSISNLSKGQTETINNLKGSLDKSIVTLTKDFTESSNILKTQLTKDSTELSKELIKTVGTFKGEVSETIDNKIKDLIKSVNTDLEAINEKVEKRLDKGFENTNKTFGDILKRLTKIDEAQKKIDSLSTDIVSLQDVLTDKKSRGIFGEVQLNQILTSVFGEKNDKIFKIQHKFDNGTIVDSVLFAPEPVGTIGIDSKFPLENYKRKIDLTLPESERKQAVKNFESDVKIHIDAIASKYIIKGVTGNQAIMFLPAEAVFAEINAYHFNIIEYAQKRNVWITSPTTLMSVLTTMQTVLNNMEREKYSSVIHMHLNKLGEEFSRYNKRWEDLSRKMKGVNDEVKKLDTTAKKIGNAFDKIQKVEIIESEVLEGTDEKIEDLLELD